MKDRNIFVLIPVIGYIGLWILGSAAFLAYFKIFNVLMESDYTAMIQRLPPALAILTVPFCSFTSFFLATRVVLRRASICLNARRSLQVGATSLVFTMAMDLLLMEFVEKISILAFPIDLMYLFAWLIIIPSVVLAGYQRQ
jgi:hypothetical protein